MNKKLLFLFVVAVLIFVFVYYFFDLFDNKYGLTSKAAVDVDVARHKISGNCRFVSDTEINKDDCSYFLRFINALHLDIHYDRSRDVFVSDSGTHFEFQSVRENSSQDSHSCWILWVAHSDGYFSGAYETEDRQIKTIRSKSIPSRNFN